jgi:hypothetical protein
VHVAAQLDLACDNSNACHVMKLPNIAKKYEEGTMVKKNHSAAASSSHGGEQNTECSAAWLVQRDGFITRQRSITPATVLQRDHGRIGCLA